MLHHIMVNASWRDIAKLFPRAVSPLELRSFKDSVITINRNDDNNRCVCPRRLALGRTSESLSTPSVSFPRSWDNGLVLSTWSNLHAPDTRARFTLARRQITHFLHIYNYTPRVDLPLWCIRTNSECIILELSRYINIYVVLLASSWNIIKQKLL